MVQKTPSLDRRKATILRAIVRDYVQTGQPVGSSRLVERYRLKVSPATIRNDMGSLEDEGYIAQPYTSAGRVPTDLGYRWFVDNWPGPEWPNLNASAQEAIDGAFQHEFGGVDEALGAISLLLSDLTKSAAVAVAPPSAKKFVVRKIDLFARDPRRATLLVVAESGEVEQGIVEFVNEKTNEQLLRLANKLTARCRGVDFEKLSGVITGSAGGAHAKPASKPNQDLEAVAKEVSRLTQEPVAKRVFRGGTANILSAEKFADIGVAHQIVEALEQPDILSNLLRAGSNAGAVLVFIGREIPIEQMRTCAAIFAPFGSDSRKGSVGVIGPTRMDYPQTISAVRAVASSLSQVFDN